MHVALMLILLLAPEKDAAKTYKLEYVFRKGDAYSDRTTREFKMEFIKGKALVRWDLTSTEVFERTILEVKQKRPEIERVIVREFIKNTKKSPDQRLVGEEKSSATGGTFVWRRVGERWGLFGQRSEVTSRYGDVVSRLKNWRDARLPTKRVKVGEKWVVPADKYLETTGQPVPPGTEGRIAFTLEKVDANGVATIRIDGVWSYRNLGSKYVVKQKGEWLFDIKRGRDLSLTASGELDVSGAQEGKGKLQMKREVTWKKPKR